LLAIYGPGVDGELPIPQTNSTTPEFIAAEMDAWKL